MTDREVLQIAEAALGNNLQWVTDQADLLVRRNDPDALARLREMNHAWVTVVKHLNGRRDA